MDTLLKDKKGGIKVKSELLRIVSGEIESLQSNIKRDEETGKLKTTLKLETIALNPSEIMQLCQLQKEGGLVFTIRSNQTEMFPPEKDTSQVI